MSKSIFSPTEKEILKIVNRHRSISTKEIADKLYGRKPKSKHFRMIISNALNRIEKKADQNDLGWTIITYNFGCKGKIVSKIKHK